MSQVSPPPTTQHAPVHFENTLQVQNKTAKFGFEDLLSMNLNLHHQEQTGTHGPDVCRFYAKGFCIKGKSCDFRHCKKAFPPIPILVTNAMPKLVARKLWFANIG